MKRYRFLSQFFLFIILILSIIFCYCSIRPYTDVTTNSISTTSSESSSGIQKISEYRLGYGDVIEVKFLNNPEFDQEVMVRPDGRISMEGVGEIYVDGLTPKRLSEQIAEIYSNLINDPKVTVIVREVYGHLVYVLGEVNSPGSFPIQKNMNFLHALATAGGTKNSANLKSVIILRSNRVNEIEAFRVDLNNPVKFADNMGTIGNLAVQPYDIIYVPKTFITNVNTFLKQVYDGVLPPLDTYLRALWWRDR